MIDDDIIFDHGGMIAALVSSPVTWKIRSQRYHIIGSSHGKCIERSLSGLAAPFEKMTSQVNAFNLFAIFLLSLSWLSRGAPQAWKWLPEDDHPCNIKRMSLEELFEKFGPRGLPPLHPEPIVLLHNRSSDRNTHFRELTRQDRILDFFEPGFIVTLSSSNSISEHRRAVPLSQYLSESFSARETTPDQASNETWYLFGETYTDEWSRLLSHYELPPCYTCTSEWVALSFGVGNQGSGVQWHVHGPGFSEALQGRKHWILYPPDQRPDFHPDQSSRQWMEYAYPVAKPLPFECTLDPGDVLYFPDRFWHATINLDPFTAFVSTFTTEHNLLLNDEL